jgi:uncharacterized protein (DUF433 family)
MEPTSTTDQSQGQPQTSAGELEVVLPVIREHIVRTPGTCWGKPRIAGTRIKVEQVVIWHKRMGMSPEEIVANWPHLNLADIYAALTYYHDYPDEIERDIAEGEKLFEELKAKQPSILEKMSQRKVDAPDDRIPPQLESYRLPCR